MKKKFAVAMDTNSKSGNEEFKEYIRENGYGWWNRINGFWLLVDSNGELSASELSTDLDEFFPGARRLVIELKEDEGTWSGYGPNNEDKNMFTWIKKNWTKP